MAKREQRARSADEIDLRYGKGPDASGVLATNLAQFLAGEGDLPDIHAGSMTRKEYDQLCKRWNAMEEGVSFCPPYNPVVVETMQVCCDGPRLRTGKVKDSKSPKTWNAKKFGPWHKKDEDGNDVPSGWYFDTSKLRCPHASKTEDLVFNPEANIVKIGTTRYVVGDNDESALNKIHAHRAGTNFGAIEESFSSCVAGKQVANLVFRIEDKPNTGGAFVVKGKWVKPDSLVTEIPFMPGIVFTPGFLTDSSGKQLNYKQIRKIVSDGGSVKFKDCSRDPIVGTRLSENEIWNLVKTFEGRKGIQRLRDREGRSEYEPETPATPRSKTKLNITTCLRIKPFEINPYGIRSIQLGCIPFVEYDADGVKGFNFVIGVRSPDGFTVSKAAARVAESVEAEAAPIDVVEEVSPVLTLAE